MPFPVLGSNSAVAEYEIDNSLRFNDDDSPKLQKTTGSNGDRQKFTFSVWVKIAQDGPAGMSLISANDGGHRPVIKIDDASEQLNVQISDSQSYVVKTNQSFRDYSAWYHIVVNMDTTQSTASNRVKIFVNGSQVTSLATADYPAQNFNSAWNANTEITVGRDISVDNKPFDGYMAELFWVDGTAYDASTFGEYNNNGVWIPKDAKDNISFGTHGFYFQFQDSSNLGDDTSGNGNDYTATNLTATDQTTDTPTNNFATLNPLMNSSQATYSEGNLDEACNDNFGVGATQAFANGKWYWEVKIKAGDNNLVGIANADFVDQLPVTFGINNYSLTVYGVNGKIYREGSEVEDVDDTYGANDIVGVAVDMDSGTRTVQFYKNGSTFGSATTLPTGWGFTIPIIRKGGSSQTSSFNFGNPSFSISSGNADANGYGNFEYAPPSGYYALCTKNLAEYG